MSWIMNFLLSSAPLISNLPNSLTNGVRPKPQTRRYSWTITREYLAPDGLNRSLILVNRQFPGPTIEANLGDTISVTVHNKLKDPPEGTAIHWHGLPQKDSKWADGVPSVTQCPIAGGSSFTYTFKPEVVGSTWWHAHFTAQYTDGLVGALIIHGPKYADYDVDLGPVLLQDYYHIDYVSYLLAVYNIPPVFIPVDTNLINGRMPFNCSLETEGRDCIDEATVAKFRFQSGKTHLLRLMNVGGATIQHFSIDNHELTVIAVDFVPIEPYTAKVVTLGIGQRTDVLVRATGKPTDAVWMRSDADVFCVNGTVWQPNATAAVYYPKADKNKRPRTKPYEWDSMNCLNDPLESTKPLAIKTPPTPDLTQTVNVKAGLNGTGHLTFTVDDSQFRANFSETLLLAATRGQTEFPNNPEYNIHNLGSAKSVRLIIKNYFPVTHTMHLHGHADFWVLAEGMGEWDGEIVNPTNPPRRDSAQMRMGFPENPSYLVIQFDADNPGVWSLHCHLVIHVSAGLYMNIMEHPDEIPHEDYESIFNQTCEPWKAFVEKYPPFQFDSGLRMVKEKRFDRSLDALERLRVEG
ncbi:extracellular dihydrogeodin oxidase/laccase-like protein [Lojkania enalia]|uniref:Extracellular dihydrogeodin oxidase/laccase-like protein n=1 Tax=Lojkania enalia TaxID=147567 RepID=A0A9P4KG14_9PLEO|nr:extracellular dihydrogeodin oxidase/laccase-like protein [Didymosphaeria enalia]